MSGGDLDQAIDYLQTIVREVRDKDPYRVAEAARNLQTTMEDYLDEHELDALAEYARSWEAIF